MPKKHSVKFFIFQWLDRLRLEKRYDTLQKKERGEKSDANENIVKHFEKKLLSLIEGYIPSNIYNREETRLFYDLQFDKTLCYENEKCFGGEKGKMNLTVLFAVNVDGIDKMKPFLIGKGIM